MNIEEVIRAIVREEISNALKASGDWLRKVDNELTRFQAENAALARRVLQIETSQPILENSFESLEFEDKVRSIVEDWADNSDRAWVTESEMIDIIEDRVQIRLKVS